MIILSHRGYWKSHSEKNKLTAFERSFSSGFGTETDIRDYDGKLVISHDIAEKSCMLVKDFFELYLSYDVLLPLALNIKADGLQLKLKELLVKYDITNYFVFDMSVPDGVQYFCADIKIFTRESEYELCPTLYDDSVGVWLDEFKSHWITQETIWKHINNKKKVCIVSPDLHKREYKEEWRHYRKIEKELGIENLMICTDYPNEAKEFSVNRIKAILFDMDGVLIEAKDWHYEALNMVLSLFGMEISRYDHLVTYDGLPTRKKLEMLTIERGLPKGLHQFIDEMKQQYTMEIVYSRCKPRFFHEFALSKLKNEAYKLVVCSNSIRNTVQIMMQKSSLEQYLDFYLSNQDVECGKPDPEIYNRAIQKLGLKAKECLIIEDNENGIKAAKASGANVMVVDQVDDVNYENIKKHIDLFEGAKND